MASPDGVSCWVVTDGRAGIEAQALGLAEALAARRSVSISRKRIIVRAPWNNLPHQMWGDPFARLDSAGDGLAPPFPDIWIGCGRLSVPFSMAVRRRNPSTFVVQLQNPRAPLSSFDLVIAPAHDMLSADNVFSIIGSTMQARAPRGASISDSKRVAVLIGGPNKAFSLTRREGVRIGEVLSLLSADGVSLSVTTSRRTPVDVADVLEERLRGAAEIFWRADRDRAEDNPYPEMLEGADAILITEDSVNMATEAASTGVMAHIFRLRRKPLSSARKFDAFHESLIERGNARYFDGSVEWRATEPMNETQRAADELLKRFGA